MRVFWISVGLLAGFLIALFAFVEPQPEVAPLAVTEQKLSSDSPFAEDVPVSAEKDSQVQLAVLPASTSGSSTDSNTQPPTRNTSGSGVVTPVSVAMADKTKASATVAVAPGSTAENAAESIETIVVDKPQPEQPATVKKPGLSMIVLEKERQKNKIAVIVHETNMQKLTENDIKALYLDRITRWQDGSRVILFNLPLGDKYREKFSETVLKMTALEADKQETKRRELRIKANDVEVKSKNVVVSYVEQHPNAVAYVPLNLVRDRSNVKVVFTIP